MLDKVELYDGEYKNYDSDVYRQVRLETYGVDFGQTSWVTTEESAQIPNWLELTSHSSVLEIGCGSGVYALHLAQTVGCSVTGIDINALGIRNANQLALDGGMGGQVRFEVCDVSQPLPFADETFDAVFANDVLCHIPGRPSLICEMHRVLKPGGIMFLKCQDQVCSGAIRWQTRLFADYAEGQGLRLVDRFDLLGKGRPQPKRTRKDGKPSKQQHAYGRPSTLLVFRKPA